jgi:hypothetical protein
MATPSLIIEKFDCANKFTNTSSNLLIENNQLSWKIERKGGQQFVYREIPAFDGDVCLTVIGQIDNWTNNCRCGVGIGDKPGTGIAIYYGFQGGGCPTNGPVITIGGAVFNMVHDSSLRFTGDWLWITKQRSYKTSLTIRGSSATVKVDEVGEATGVVEYTGQYSTLWIGNRGDGDWPCCAGKIFYVSIEPLLSQPDNKTITQRSRKLGIELL